MRLCSIAALRHPDVHCAAAVTALQPRPQSLAHSHCCQQLCAQLSQHSTPYTHACQASSVTAAAVPAAAAAAVAAAACHALTDRCLTGR
jgi:hypothetical protein